MGAVSGAQLGLKMMTSATMKPPKTPPIIHGTAAAGVGECDKPQVHAAVATTQSKRKPVLLTVPCSVIASPKATWPLKAFSLSAGLEVRIRLAMDISLIGYKYQSTPPGTQVQNWPPHEQERAQFALRSPAIWLWTCSLNLRGFWIFSNVSGVPPVPRTITVP